MATRIHSQKAAEQVIVRESTEEKLVWYSLVFTYAFFAIGGTYVVGCVIGWLIFGVAMLRYYVQGRPVNGCIPVLIWIWVFFMMVMLIALWIAHDNYDLGTGKTIKSSIGWMKGWALLALFPLLGALCSIRPQVIIRACCIVSAHSILFALLGFVLAKVGFSGQIFLSPLKAIGGPGADFFNVSLFSMNPETGAPRWRFFGPWAPSAGLLSCVYLVICSQETHKFWRNLGILGAVVMCFFCQSRAGMVIFVFLIPLLILDKQMTNPKLWILATLVVCTILLLGEPIIQHIFNTYEEIKQARPKSTQVRAALEDIALQRWESEAPIWGHGIVEAGPKSVEFMPIGSHHSWLGLLFVKGIVGFFALFIPMLLTGLYLLIETPHSKTARIGLLLFIILVCYSFTENLEILTYLFWPALIWIGMALNPMKRNLLETEVTPYASN